MVEKSEVFLSVFVVDLVKNFICTEAHFINENVVNSPVQRRRLNM